MKSWFLKREAIRALRRAERSLRESSLADCLKFCPQRVLNSSEFEVAKGCAVAIETAATKAKDEYFCLPQAVALSEMLARRKLSARFVFGYLAKSQRDLSGTSATDMELQSIIADMENRHAHIWVEIEHPAGNWQAILGGKEAQKYGVVAQFPN